MDVEEGTFLGNTKNSTVTFQYEKYKETKDWFCKSSLLFSTCNLHANDSLGSTDFSPGASVEKERKLFMIIYQKGIHQRRN